MEDKEIISNKSNKDNKNNKSNKNNKNNKEDTEDEEDIKYEDKKLDWSINYENIFADWCDKAMSYRYLHTQCNRYYNNFQTSITIPVIFISTITGVANFAQERVPLWFVPIYTIIVGGLNILAGFITTISHFLKIAELNEGHRVSAISWGKFCRNIKIELAKHPNEREPLEIYLKKAKEQYDLLLETSPFIRHKEIILFNKKFKNNQFYKPEICDNLISVVDTIYKPVIKESCKDNTIQIINNIKEQKTNITKSIEIEEFMKKYRKENNRDPTTEEIYDNLQDAIEKKYIDKFFTKLKKSKDIV